MLHYTTESERQFTTGQSKEKYLAGSFYTSSNKQARNQIQMDYTTSVYETDPKKLLDIFPLPFIALDAESCESNFVYE